MSITDTATLVLITDTDGQTVTVEGEQLTDRPELADYVISSLSYPLSPTRDAVLDGGGMTVEELTDWEESDGDAVILDALMVYADNQHTATLPEVLELAEECADSYIGCIEAFQSAEDVAADWIGGIYDESELPEWARSHYGAILASMAHDMFAGGEAWESYGYVFRSF